MSAWLLLTAALIMVLLLEARAIATYLSDLESRINRQLREIEREIEREKEEREQERDP